jgi:transposase-like protein
MKRIKKEEQRNPMNEPLQLGISQWSEGERSDPKRNGEMPSRRLGPAGDSSPNSEIIAKPKRRRFTASYKAKIVREAATCTHPGQVGALLRREGLYSSQLAAWRLRYQHGEEAGLQENKRGRKPKQSALEKENARLSKQLQRTEKELTKAKLIIELQKKIADILGIVQPEAGDSGSE